MTQADPQEPTFEQALVRLRETVQALEEGDLPLAEATRLFERGMELARRCNELLSAADLQVTRLERSFVQQMTMLQSERRPGEAGDEP